MNPLIFDIQRFSIHDGPGIRTVVFFKGCNLECPWCQNPESIELNRELAFYPDKCISSGDCQLVCPHGAIDLKSETRINRELCIVCPKCSEACLSDALKIVGKNYSEKEVLEEILKDKDYYNNSGGGVTLSGGEPSLHSRFALSILKLCKEEHIPTNIETNGYFKWEKFKQLLPFLDLIFFDIKIINSEKHKNILHGNSEAVLHNMKMLVENNAPVEFRLPLIPEYTATEENINDILAILKELNIKKLHVLPYHNMGESKADKIESPLPKLKLKSFTEKEIFEITKQFEDQNIEVILNR